MKSAKKIVFITSLLLNGAALGVYLHYWNPSRTLLRGNPIVHPKLVEKTSAPKVTLKEAILKQRTQIESCYDDYLRREPAMMNGSIAVTWFLDKQGKVIEPEIVDTDLKDVDLEECVLQEVVRMTFDPAEFSTDVKFSYRFKFKARAPAAVDFQ